MEHPPVYGTVILIERDISVREMLEAVLRERFKTVVAHSAENALQIAQAESPFDIVISSFSLPGMDGLEFLSKIGKLFPKTVRVLLSGDTRNSELYRSAISDGHISQFFLKPFSILDLLNYLEECLEKSRSSQINRLC